ncbi:Abi family protein [Microbacterium sp. 2P01SA-2]|uniref:Abi family protein n=1 Tax=unclassified Microbacterium TaxID=2609290 RepID=UPI0039A352EE
MWAGFLFGLRQWDRVASGEAIPHDRRAGRDVEGPWHDDRRGSRAVVAGRRLLPAKWILVHLPRSQPRRPRRSGAHRSLFSGDVLLAHEDLTIFPESFDHARWLAKARSRVDRAARISPFIRHHAERYGGVIPIWVLVDVLDFSDVSMLFDGMSTGDQYAVAEELGIHMNLDALRPLQRRKAVTNHPLARGLEQLTIVRNISAHHGRLWNRKLVPVGTNALRTASWLDASPRGQSERVYGALTIVAKSLETTSPGSIWASRVAHLISTLADLPERSVRDMGFPPDWQTFPIWQG